MPAPRASEPRLPYRLLWGSMLVALLVASPASAYRVFFDYDEDGNPDTFQNEAVGPETVPVKVVVELDRSDGSPPWIHFFIHWSCEDDFLLGRGSIQNEECCTYPAVFPFTKINWETCQLSNCWCEASREFVADFRSPVLGQWELTTLELSRVGYTGKVHENAEFWIECPSCDYVPGDESRLIMSVRSESARRETATWGRLKARYR